MLARISREEKTMVRKVKSALEAVPCRVCQRPVLWVKHPNLGEIPVDAEPSPDGTFRILDDGGYEIVGLPRLGTRKNREGPLHTAHLATCPAGGTLKK
jgi:hypothetical protein